MDTSVIWRGGSPPYNASSLPVYSFPWPRSHLFLWLSQIKSSIEEPSETWSHSQRRLCTHRGGGSEDQVSSWDYSRRLQDEADECEDASGGSVKTRFLPRGTQNLKWRSSGLKGCRLSSCKIFTINRPSRIQSLISPIPQCHRWPETNRNNQWHISSLPWTESSSLTLDVFTSF